MFLHCFAICTKVDCIYDCLLAFLDGSNLKGKTTIEQYFFSPLEFSPIKNGGKKGRMD